MREAEWCAGTDLKAMLDFLSDKASNRKFRLFACACVRRVWDLLMDERSRNAVVVAEQFADGLASKEQMDLAAAQAKTAAEAQQAQAARSPRSTMILMPSAKAALEAQQAAVNAHWAASWTAVGAGKVAAWAAAKNTDRTRQADLLREIIGNPFFTPEVPRSWSPAVLMLAKGLYAGEQGHGGLQMLLAKVGHEELAEHFRDPEQKHPKGCWGLDLILGKS
jgi:hypothetical protein